MTLHAYLATWLVCLALPAGALPLVMAADLAGWNADALRRLLILMPPAAIAVVPILLMPHGLWFCVRAIVGLCVWSGLALIFRRPPTAPRRAVAIAGLILHAIIGTAIATDFVLGLNPTLTASGFGLLFMTAQCGMALAAALLLAPAKNPGFLLLIPLAAWAFLHFTQYLIIWSANQPGDISFYLTREAPFAQAVAWIGAAALLSATLFAWLRHPPAWLLPAAAGLVLLTHAAEMIWLATPSIQATS